MPESIAVSVKNVSKQFDNVEVLRDINLTVEKGTVVSILGSSGSGKSTLLRCMNWLEQPDRGEIHIGGQRLGIDEQRGRGDVAPPAGQNPRAGGDGLSEF
ncbi:ABC transporter [Klebsiella pneumoniae]|uniref:ABC transporter n=1 Tax=Klebsiella pneumoniae TaxID=573 RepID=A0A378F8U5_KLEPN|nr:ABC transporter [Klebsiella pneumoniae]